MSAASSIGGVVMRTIIEKHIDDVRQGDVVLHDGTERTVSGTDITSGFFGRSLFGDSYRMGTVLVKVVVYSAV